MPDNEQTQSEEPKFDFSAFPDDVVFHERRDGPRRGRATNGSAPPKPRLPVERRARKERRRRIDPTTFEKQYTDDELEFMNAMQKFKMHTGKQFPTHGEVLKVAFSLGYRKLVSDAEDDLSTEEGDLEEAGSY